MRCHIYKSLKQDEMYLYLQTKDDFSVIPDALVQRIGRLQWVMELELTPQRQLAREDVNKVMESLRDQGFFIQMPPLVSPDHNSLKNRQVH